MKRYKNILLLISFLVNIGLAIYCYSIFQNNSKTALPLNTKIRNGNIPDFEITSMKNFENVYYDMNDSIYKEMWGKAFENEPEKAFLISCSYYFIRRDTNILKDIKISVDQLDQAYQNNMKINFDSLEEK